MPENGATLTAADLKLKENEALALVHILLEGLRREKAIIRDPYCGTNTSRLRELIQFLKQNATALNSVEAHCRELHSEDKRYESVPQMTERVQRELSFRDTKVSAYVASFHKHRLFHDRSLEISIISSGGLKLTHNYDLSGGVDHLIDKSRATTVYRYAD